MGEGGGLEAATAKLLGNVAMELFVRGLDRCAADSSSPHASRTMRHPYSERRVVCAALVSRRSCCASCSCSAARFCGCTSPWCVAPPCCAFRRWLDVPLRVLPGGTALQDETKAPRTYGFVRFADERSGEYACRVLNGTKLFGKVSAPPSNTAAAHRCFANHVCSPTVCTGTECCAPGLTGPARPWRPAVCQVNEPTLRLRTLVCVCDVLSSCVRAQWRPRRRRRHRDAGRVCDVWQRAGSEGIGVVGQRGSNVRLCQHRITPASTRCPGRWSRPHGTPTSDTRLYCTKSRSTHSGRTASSAV